MERKESIGQQSRGREFQGQERHVPQEWQIYEKWEHETPLLDKVWASRSGKWPEVTPQEVIDIETKTTRRERLLTAVGKFTPFGEIQSRTVEEAQRMEALEQQVVRDLPGLTDREKLVVRGRFGLEDGRSRTQADIAQEINRSPRTVRRDEYSALRKIKLASQQPRQ